MPAPGTPTVGTVMLDCSDLDTMVAFWTELLGIEEATRFHGYVWLTALPDAGPALAFQQVPEPKTGKNRMHLDIGVDDAAAFTARVLDLGGAHVEDHTVSGFHWSVLADPEGNEFCIMERGAE